MPIINYIGAGLWIVSLIALTILILVVIFKKFRLGAMIVGALLLVSSVPAAFMLKFSLNGCCGAPSIGFNGMGYVGGILIAMVGMDLIV